MKPSSTLESAFRTHLVGAAGYYHHLLFRLQQEYILRLDGIVDVYMFSEPKSRKLSKVGHGLFPIIENPCLFLTEMDFNVTFLLTDKKPHSGKKEFDVSTIDWALKACHRCLVYLGDIGKYAKTAPRFVERSLKYMCLLVVVLINLAAPSTTKPTAPLPIDVSATSPSPSSHHMWSAISGVALATTPGVVQLVNHMTESLYRCIFYQNLFDINWLQLSTELVNHMIIDL